MQRSRVAYKAVTSIGWRISYSLSFGIDAGIVHQYIVEMKWSC